MAQHRAALLREARHVEDHAGLALDMGGHAEQRADGEHAGAADSGHRDVERLVQRCRRRRQWQRHIAQLQALAASRSGPPELLVLTADRAMLEAAPGR